MTAEEIKEQKEEIFKTVTTTVRDLLKEHQTKIDTLILKYKEEVANRGGDADNETKKALEAEIAKLNGRIDGLQINQKKFTPNVEDIMTFKTRITQTLEENKQKLADIYEGRASRMKMEIPKQIFKDMTTPNNLTGDLPRQYGSEFIYPPFRRVHMRTLIPGGSLSQGIFTYPEKIATTGDPASQYPEGSTKAQIDYSIEMKDAKAVTIAAILVISKQMLDDIEGLQSYISLQMQEDLLIEEDRQILRGTGASNQLLGIEQVATAYVTTTSETDRWSIMGDAASQLEALNYDVTANLVNPKDWWAMVLNKESGAGFNLPAVMAGLAPLNIAGIPIRKSTAIAADTFLTGTFDRGAQLLNREGLSIDVSFEDGENFKKNLVTFRVEERLAMPIYHPSGFIFGDFGFQS
jgi:HK97 family phage major capsid protein